MNLDAVTDRLRSTARPPLKTVEGAASYASADGLSRGVAQSPAAWVIPLSEEATPNRAGTFVVQQTVRARVGVVLALRDVSDPKGGRAISSLQTVRDAVIDKLVGWTPTGVNEPITFVRGRLIDTSNAVTWWLDEFTTSFFIRKT